MFETLDFTSELMLLFVQENMCPNKSVDHVVSRLVRLLVLVTVVSNTAFFYMCAGSETTFVFIGVKLSSMKKCKEMDDDDDDINRKM